MTSWILYFWITSTGLNLKGIHHEELIKDVRSCLATDVNKINKFKLIVLCKPTKFPVIRRYLSRPCNTSTVEV